METTLTFSIRCNKCEQTLEVTKFKYSGGTESLDTFYVNPCKCSEDLISRIEELLEAEWKLEDLGK